VNVKVGSIVIAAARRPFVVLVPRARPDDEGSF
jgi:hypothetical protein